jgi:hypothetical protein
MTAVPSIAPSPVPSIDTVALSQTSAPTLSINYLFVFGESHPDAKGLGDIPAM